MDARLRELLQGGVAIVVATRDAANIPVVTRGGGCYVRPDDSMVLYVATDQSARWLGILRCTGSIATVFGVPHTYESYQVKGSDARIVVLDEADRERVQAYRRALFANLVKIGMPESLSAGMLPQDPMVFVGVEFTPSEIYCQTPGPGAGARIR
jgi:hypothetical protein